jgi:hypothetical protein
MLLPRDEPKYERLNTSFTNFGELLTELSNQRHTGYLKISFPGYEGIVLLESGAVVNAVQQIGERRMAGEEAMRDIGARARERNGSIGAYCLPGSVVSTLAMVVGAEPVHRDLSASFTSLERLIAKLQADRHTGYLEVTTAGDQCVGFVIVRAGEVVEAVLSAEGQQMTGPHAVQRLVQIAPETGALFHLYRATNGTAQQVPAQATLSDPTSRHQDHAGMEPPSAPQHDADDQADPAEVLRRSLEVWQEIMSRIEAVIDGCSSKGTFSAAFKRSLVANSGAYPFLDPFAAEFEYQDGRIRYLGTPDHAFNSGLGLCLRETVRMLAGQLKQKNLVALIRTTLAAPIARYIETIDELDLRATLPELLS